MAAPYWVTDAGDLGTIQEQEFYSLQLTGRDPEESANNTGLTFTLLAGKLPGGVALAYTGLIDGIPTQRSLLKGVPYEVSDNVTSTFVVRITDAESLLADRTFNLTVAGPDSPVWSTTAGKIADVHDGQEVATILAATDTDLDVLTYSINSGSLPPGLTMTTTGVISGRISKFSIASADFNFVVRVTDGNVNVDRQFSYRVHAIGDATIDTEEDAFGVDIKCDSTSTMWTADTYVFARPYMVRATGSVGTLRHSNYYIELFEGKTLEDLPQISFERSGNLPQGTTFNGTYETDATDKVGSCLVYGEVPSTTASSTAYTFKIRPKTVHNDSQYIVLAEPGMWEEMFPAPGKSITIYGEWIEYTLIVRGAADIEVTWS
jgi:hypothetical protein